MTALLATYPWHALMFALLIAGFLGIVAGAFIELGKAIVEDRKEQSDRPHYTPDI